MAPGAPIEHFHGLVAEYYSDRVRRFGPTPRGVDWKDAAGQELRFSRLMEICGDPPSGTIVELGCGYGALLGYLRARGSDVEYFGYDISSEMVAAARQTFGTDRRARFNSGAQPAEPADYCLASGIFNVRFEFSDADWRSYIFETLDVMARTARRGFAFNCLTAFSDPERMERRLYYADPGEMLDRCLARYGRHVALRHDYGLYEFTMLIRHGDAKQ